MNASERPMVSKITVTLKEGLSRFELARRLIGHTATLTRAEVGALPERHLGQGSGTINYRVTLTAYAQDLRVKRDAVATPGRPLPVLPVIDSDGGLVFHETTVATRVAVDVGSCWSGVADLSITRWCNPLCVSDGRDVALAWILGAESLLRHGLGHDGDSWIGTPSDVVVVDAVAKLMTVGLDDEAILLYLPGRYDLDKAVAAIGRMRHAAWTMGDADLQVAWETRHPDDPVSAVASEARTLLANAAMEARGLMCRRGDDR